MKTSEDVVSAPNVPEPIPENGKGVGKRIGKKRRENKYNIPSDSCPRCHVLRTLGDDAPSNGRPRNRFADDCDPSIMEGFFKAKSPEIKKPR